MIGVQRSAMAGKARASPALASAQNPSLGEQERSSQEMRGEQRGTFRPWRVLELVMINLHSLGSPSAIQLKQRPPHR
jgi:hypothetical protein